MVNDALRLMRVFHDMTQTELASSLGISKSHLSEIESGKKNPTLSLLDRYGEVFGVPTSSILFFSENMENASAGEKARTLVSSKILALMRFIAERSSDQHAT
jgi:transcriptional regulator with XRE-family HTH domain